MRALHLAVALALTTCALAAHAAPIYTTTTYVGYNPAAPTSNFGAPTNVNSETAYTVRTGADSTYFYVDVTATPPNGASVDQFANIYLGGPSFSGIVIETTNDRFTLLGGSTYYSLAGTGYSYNAATNDISFALPFAFLENDPDGAGFSKVKPGDLIRVSYSQSFGYSFDGGSTSTYDQTTRLGAQIVPSTVAATPEPSSIALLGTGLLSIGGVLRKRLVRA